MKTKSFFARFLSAAAGLLIVSILFAACAGFNAPGRAGQNRRMPRADGVYEGTAPGRRGPIHVQVRLEAGSIAEINIADSSEDQFVGGAAMEELLELVLTYNTTDLDAVSGATESSEGFLAAVENAILAP
jgi:uncharacterized protein with FMN-binding domain